jgi:hypothetical protein
VLKGDIDNAVEPRLLLVWENLVALPPQEAEGVKRWFQRKTLAKAVNAWTLNSPLALRLYDITYRKGYNVDVVSFMDHEFEEAIRDWCEDRHHLPVGQVYTTDPDILAREIAWRPEVAAIYDPNPGHIFTWGSKGRIVNSAAPDLFGLGR